MSVRIIRNNIKEIKADAIISFVNEQCEVSVTKHEGILAKNVITAGNPFYALNETSLDEAEIKKTFTEILNLAKENEIKSLAIPVANDDKNNLSKEEIIRLFLNCFNEINHDDLEIILVIDNDKTSGNIESDLKDYIAANYVDKQLMYESSMVFAAASMPAGKPETANFSSFSCERTFAKKTDGERTKKRKLHTPFLGSALKSFESDATGGKPDKKESSRLVTVFDECREECIDEEIDFESEHESKLEERMKHISDTFSQYLLYLIKEKNLENADVYKRAVVDKKTFSKIKNNEEYHPQKITALCLCVGAKLNLDETKDLLARAGYALSPCDKTDIIFSYFIENEIYDMIELDIQLEEHGLPCIIS